MKRRSAQQHAATARVSTRATERDELRQRILATVDTIPRGCVATYGDVAREAGLPRHARLVGRVLGELAIGARVPWHRVVNAAGKISLRGDGRACAEQLRRLAREGVVPRSNGALDLARCRWDPAALALLRAPAAARSRRAL